MSSKPKGPSSFTSFWGNIPAKTYHPEGPARHLDASRQTLTPHCLAAMFDSQLPSPKLSLKLPPNLPLPHKRGFVSSFKITPAVRVIAQQLSGKKSLAAIFASRHQDASPGPLGKGPGSVWFGYGLGVERFERFRFSVTAVPMQKGFFCVSAQLHRKGRFRFRFLENGSGGFGSAFSFGNKRVRRFQSPNQVIRANRKFE